MSVRTYYMDDSTITVPSGYRDRTVHVLEWALEGSDKIALVVQREPLPRAGADEALHVESLDRFVAAQTRGYPAQFAGFHLERDEAASEESGFEMRRKVFRWRHEVDVVYHHQVFALLGADVLVLTASAKALHRDAVDRLAGEALSGLRIRGEDDRE